MRVHYWELSLYNEGTLVGCWFDLDGVTKDEHLEEVNEWLEELGDLHERWCEEIILGDVEDIPSHMHHEYGLCDELWEYIEFLNNTHLDPEIVEAAMECDIPLEHVEDAYVGSWSSDSDFAYDMAEQLGYIGEVERALPAWITCHIDWDGVARDLMVDHTASNGHYFSTCY